MMVGSRLAAAAGSPSAAAFAPDAAAGFAFAATHFFFLGSPAGDFAFTHAVCRAV